jgi:DNA processing protein
MTAAVVREDAQTQQELTRYLALLRVPHLGSSGIRMLLQHFPDPGAVFDASPRKLQSMGLHAEAVQGLREPDWRGAEEDLEWLRDSDTCLLLRDDPRYPPLLKEIPDPPPVLFIRGNVEALSSLQIAIVGSRNPSPSGRRTARRFAAELGYLGVTVTSGLALGIDSQAHAGALESGAATVAVLGCGLKTVYPRSNLDLAHSICSNGALVTEFPPAMRPLAENFPRRNRLISGLSLGVLVVEAALKSGSLITARLAMEQGREVFAIPGAIHNPVAHGCHYLIRQGAKLTESIEDIIEEIPTLAAALKGTHKVASAPQHSEGGVDGAAKVLLDNIGDEPVTIDTLFNLTTLPVDEISANLLNLELQGLIESLPGGAYVRR